MDVPIDEGEDRQEHGEDVGGHVLVPEDVSPLGPELGHTELVAVGQDLEIEVAKGNAT